MYTKVFNDLFNFASFGYGSFYTANNTIICVFVVLLHVLQKGENYIIGIVLNCVFRRRRNHLTEHSLSYLSEMQFSTSIDPALPLTVFQ